MGPAQEEPLQLWGVRRPEDKGTQNEQGCGAELEQQGQGPQVGPPPHPVPHTLKTPVLGWGEN